MNSFTGFGKYLHVLEAKGIALDLRVLLVIATIGVAGSLLGNRLARRLPQVDAAQAVRRVPGCDGTLRRCGCRAEVASLTRRNGANALAFLA